MPWQAFQTTLQEQCALFKAFSRMRSAESLNDKWHDKAVVSVDPGKLQCRHREKCAKKAVYKAAQKRTPSPGLAEETEQTFNDLGIRRQTRWQCRCILPHMIVLREQ
jgi:hypothetical protein